MKLFRNPEAMWREEDRYLKQAEEGRDRGEDVTDVGTSIILHAGKMLSLNMLGTEIWKLCDGRTADEIIGLLGERFDVDEETLRQDVHAFLENLRSEGLIHEA